MGVPALTGPHDFNFATINAELRAVGALQTVHDATELANAFARLLTNADARQEQISAGQAVLDANRGTVSRQMAVLTPLLLRP